jgi:putative ABC transport system ATP-binding protein
MSLILNEVKKSYSQGEARIQVLRGGRVEVKKGEVVAVLGQSGSGKSTLLSLLSGLDRPDTGEISVEGVVINSLTEDEVTLFRAQNIGIVFQQFHLLAHLSALENVMLPLEILKESQAQAEMKAKAMLESLGLGHRLSHYPGQMSGGECQRVAIARALVVKPKLLLADEPSGNLDVETGHKVMDIFFEVVRKTGTTTILVTHSPDLAAQCDRQIHLRSGIIQ